MEDLIQIHTPEGNSLPAEQKETLLLARLAEIPSLIVALSGGADSAYLAWAAHEALGARALCITALSPSYSPHDRTIVEEFVSKLGLRHEFIETHEMENPAYRANSADRCYFCKDELFSALDELAHTRGFAAVAYGVNADDTLDFRPGHRAATEHQVLAPLLDAGLAKADIRLLQAEAGRSQVGQPARVGSSRLSALARPPRSIRFLRRLSTPALPRLTFGFFKRRRADPRWANRHASREAECQPWQGRHGASGSCAASRRRPCQG